MNVEDRLSKGVEKLKGRKRSDELVERWLMIGGGVLILGGIAAICIGWFGASHTELVFEQIPYMVSGGLLGLGLVVAGSGFYFSYWLTRMVRESREQREQADRTLRTMNEVAELIASALREDEPAPASPNGQFVVTRDGTMVHRRECSVVAGRSDLRTVSATEPGLEPCKMCNPLGTEAATTAR